MGAAAAAIAAAAAGIGGSIMQAEQQRKANRQARIFAEQGRADTLAARSKAETRAEALNVPLFSSADVNKLQRDYSQSIYGGSQAGMQAIRNSMAARGLSKSGLSDEQMFDFNLKQAMAKAQGFAQIQQQAQTQNRGALTNYINMANAATLGLQPTLNQQTQNMQQIALANPYAQMWGKMGSNISSGIGGAYGAYQSQQNFDKYMNLLAQQNQGQGNYNPMQGYWKQQTGSNQPWNQNWSGANIGYK